MVKGSPPLNWNTAVLPCTVSAAALPRKYCTHLHQFCFRYGIMPSGSVCFPLPAAGYIHVEIFIYPGSKSLWDRYSRPNTPTVALNPEPASEIMDRIKRSGTSSWSMPM